MKLNKLNFEILQHAAYSPDLSFFFKYLDHFLAGKTFSTTIDIKNAINDFIYSDFFINETYHIVDHWQKCIDIPGAYFDK